MRTNVCVQGLGFVGSAMAVAVAAARGADRRPLFDVTGLDLPTAQGRERIESIERGEFPFGTTDSHLLEATTAAHREGNLHATSDPAAFASADVVLVDVHLDVIGDGGPPRVDFTGFRHAIATVGEHLKPGALVIVETTVPPGTCARVVAPALQDAFRRRGLPENGFLLAHSYERVMPGQDYLASITNFWRVYAGLTEEAADACERFLANVVNVKDFPLTRLDSTTASEMAKVIENSYRATTIAFVEEWARFGEAVGVDLFQIVDAIRVRPTHSNMRQPGFGVGGYCLTKDPLFGGIAARQLFDRPDLGFPFSEMAVTTNSVMPLVSVERLQGLLDGDVRGKRVLLLGAAYRQEVGDTRYSPSQTFVEELLRRGASVLVHDPLVRSWPEAGLAIESALPAANDVDAVVFAVPHRSYRELDLGAWLDGAAPAVLDANAVLTREQRRVVMDKGCRFAAVGEG